MIMKDFQELCLSPRVEESPEINKTFVPGQRSRPAKHAIPKTVEVAYSIGVSKLG